jgi:hypothetical protein
MVYGAEEMICVVEMLRVLREYVLKMHYKIYRVSLYLHLAVVKSWDKVSSHMISTSWKYNLFHE